MEAKQWYVICYDITEPKRWRKVYKKLNGYGRRLQYSIFRCRLTRRQIEKLRWELEEMLDASEDRLLILSICESASAMLDCIIARNPGLMIHDHLTSLKGRKHVTLLMGRKLDCQAETH